MGEIPGAYAKAFDFTDFLDSDVDSNEEMDELREGLVAVKLTRETKLQIRKPWSNALIIKLYGRKVGFSFLQNKLNLLWKPIGRLDCVDLGEELSQIFSKRRYGGCPKKWTVVHWRPLLIHSAMGALP